MTNSDIEAQLARLLADDNFARNERMSALLRHLVDRTINGRVAELKEVVVAVEVFGRAPDYDPRRDSIVRTEVGRLRARLATYYAGVGHADPIVIEIPKGAYVAQFHQRVPVAPPVAVAPPPRTRVRPWMIAAAVCMVAVGSAVLVWALRPARPFAVGILPFENVTRDPEEQVFADGLTDETIRQLSNIEGLTVASAPDADFLVRGAVRRDGPRVRMNVQLVRGTDQAPVWSEKYDRDLAGLFDIQNEISTNIVNHLRLLIGGGRRRYERSLKAYDLYQRARAMALPSDVDSNEAATRMLEAVVAEDPEFAPAYADLAVTYAWQSTQFPSTHDAGELDRIRVAADRAIQLDPLLAEAHHARGMYYARLGEWASSERSFRRAIELAPARPATYEHYAMWMLLVVGRVDDALEQIRMAESLEPESVQLRLDAGWLLLAQERYTEAGRYCSALPADFDLRGQCVGRWHLGEGRTADAIAVFSTDRRLAKNPQTRGLLGYAYARAGRVREAEALADAARFANERALIFAGLRDRARTLQALEETLALGPQRFGGYVASPEFRFLRNDPDLVPLLRAARIPVDSPSLVRKR